LTQPVFPGVETRKEPVKEALEPNVPPEQSNQFEMTCSRQINSKTTVEFGYIGRNIITISSHPNINAVPYI